MRDMKFDPMVQARQCRTIHLQHQRHSAIVKGDPKASIQAFQAPLYFTPTHVQSLHQLQQSYWMTILPKRVESRTRSSKVRLLDPRIARP